MRISELTKIIVTGHGKARRIVCCYCGKETGCSILPHIRADHQDEWEKWKRVMLEEYNCGRNPKQIMKAEFTNGERYLFTWRVIEKEINKMIEDGSVYTPNIKKDFSKWEPEDFSLERKTIWRFQKRGDWATHNGSYRGNWPPQIPRNMILRYTEDGDTVLDPFMGGGTTIVESLLLGRNAIGVDINKRAITLTKAQIDCIRRRATADSHQLPPSDVKIEVGDARNLDNIPDESVDLVCTHPPYLNFIGYSNGIEGDLSRIKECDEFLRNIGTVASELYRVSKTGGHCAILMGDIKKNGGTFPMGFEVMRRFENAGFNVAEIIVKEQFNDRSSAFYAKGDAIRLNHEYLFVFQKK